MGITAQGRLGVGQAPLPRARPRLPDAGLHLRRHRRHVRRRVRQRHAAVASTSACSPRSTTATSSSTRTRMPRAVLRRARAHVRAAALELGRLRQVADLARAAACFRAAPSRSRCRAGGARGARHRRRRRADDAERADERDPQGAGRPAVERRHRHLRQGDAARAHADVGDRANNALRVNGERAALQGGGRGRQPRHDPARPHRGRAARRAAQHRLHRQLRRRRHLRPRGQHQDPAQRRGAARRADAWSSATRCWRA